MSCNCGKPASTANAQRSKKSDAVVRRQAREEMNPGKVLEVSAYRCGLDHVLVTPDSPYSATRLLDDCLKGQEPRVRLKPRAVGSPAALRTLGLPRRDRIGSRHLFGQTTVGAFMRLCDKFPYEDE